jgi:septal ring factor EnvC (AmiA/AmiB activator)
MKMKEKIAEFIEQYRTKKGTLPPMYLIHGHIRELTETIVKMCFEELWEKEERNHIESQLGHKRHGISNRKTRIRKLNDEIAKLEREEQKLKEELDGYTNVLPR